jgi:hypothetical protein
MKEVAGLLRRGLLVLEAGALMHFDVKSLFETPLGHRIGLFHWVSASGRQRTWAVLSWVVGMWTINLVPSDALTECRRWLQDVIGFTKFERTGNSRRTGVVRGEHCHE